MSCTSQNVEACTRQGSTRNLSIGFKDGSSIDANWTCYLQVRVKSTHQLTDIDREVTTKNVEGTKFITTLTSTETVGLSEGSYVVAMEMSNTLTGEVIEGLLDLKITKQWVVRP